MFLKKNFRPLEITAKKLVDSFGTGIHLSTLKDSLIDEMLEFSKSVLISINVPPLKSMPRFNPLKTNNNTEITIKNDERYNIFFLMLIN